MNNPLIQKNNPDHDVLKGMPGKQLNLEEEAVLAKRIKASEKKDEDAINELVMHSMREAFAYAMVCCQRKLSPGEIVSLCYSALHYAAQNYEAGATRFFAYAKVYVRGEICKTFETLCVVKRGSSITLPPAEQCDLNDDSHPKETQGTDPNDQTFRTVDIVEPDTEGIANRDEWGFIKPILQKLNEKERTIIQLRFMSGFNFREIGELFGTSRSDAEASCRRALKKIRCELFRKKALFR